MSTCSLVYNFYSDLNDRGEKLNTISYQFTFDSTNPSDTYELSYITFKYDIDILQLLLYISYSVTF